MCISPLYRWTDKAYNGLKRGFEEVSGVRGQIISSTDYKRFIRQFGRSEEEFDKIPCGQCVECRLNYSKNWAIRCLLEEKTSSPHSCWFVTITYDDQHLPAPISILNKKNFSIVEMSPLVKRDYQLFLKRLRKRAPGVRFYGCGEYGDHTFRPHFHFLLFNLPLNDLVPNPIFSKKNISEIGENILYESKFLNSCWTDKNNDLKGLIAVAPLSFNSAAYVSRYCMKKITGNAWKNFKYNFEVFDKNGEVMDFPRPFVQMSVKPGIGYNYLFSNKEKILNQGNIALWFNNSLNFCSPSRYLEKIAEKEGIPLEDFKLKKKITAENNFLLMLEKSGCSEEEFYLNQKDILENRKKRLVRFL